MKGTAAAATLAAPAEVSLPTEVGGVRLASYLALAKPRIALMSLLVVAAGYALGRADEWPAASLGHALLGIGLVAVASSVFNQILERRTDALMRRTQDRPLPAGRIGVQEAAAVGGACLALGTAWLFWFVDSSTALWTAATFLLYVCAYTPLKSRLPLATAVGAIPGALPPVLGWLAAGRPADFSAFVLFGVLFLWQFPHFLAIAWIYRDDYSRAGLKMLPTQLPVPRLTGVLAFAYSVALLPISLLPTYCGLAGRTYLVGAVALGVWYAAAALRFAVAEDRATARLLLRTSLFYLPTLLALMVWDHYRLLA